jgi:hypothetical protein
MQNQTFWKNILDIWNSTRLSVDLSDTSKIICLKRRLEVEAAAKLNGSFNNILCYCMGTAR